MRIVIADDSLLLREGLQLLLAEAGHEVVGSVGDGPSFVAQMLQHRPDIGIVDVRMPPSNTDEGLRAAVDVRRTWPEARLMVLSQYVEVSYADDLEVRVQDDGVGGAHPAKGLGLSGLRQRLTAVDGTLEVTSPEGGPTVVLARIPLGGGA